MRLIDADALIAESLKPGAYNYVDTWQIANAPTIDPVRHGRWLKGGYVCGETEWICSVCGETEWRTNCNRMKYCMFCGAKMDEGEDDDKG